MGSTRPSWNSKDISRLKQTVAQRMAEQGLSGKAKIAALLKMFEEDEAPDKNEALYRFLLVLFILSEHAKGTPLKRKTFSMLVKLAEASLRRFGVSPKRSRVDFLYEDFHLILSQIYLQKGRILSGSWSQILAMRCDGDYDLKLLALGSSALRRGQTELAMSLFDQVNTAQLLPDRKEQWLAKKILALRMQGNFQQASTEIQKALEQGDLSHELRNELKWEQLALEVHQGESLLPLFRAVDRNREHHRLAYAFEVFLWSRAVATEEWIKKFPTLKKIVADTEMRISARSPLGQVARALEACYQTKFDLDYRLSALGETMELRDSLENVQQELLLLGAGLRFLIRAQLESAARFWQAEYESLCLRMTAGENRDLLVIRKK